MSFNGNQYTSDAGFDLDTKGQVHTYSTENAALDLGTNTYVLQADSTTSTGLVWSDPENLKHAVALQVACSDETTALTTGTAKCTFRLPWGLTLNSGIAGVIASLTTAGTGANLVTVDINEGGSTILSTKITLDATEKTSYSAATPVVISDTSLAFNAEMTVDIDQIDSGGVSSGLKIMLIGDLT